MSMNITKEQLARLLQEAEKAHAEYEKQLAERDENWPEWYADFIISKIENNS